MYISTQDILSKTPMIEKNNYGMWKGVMNDNIYKDLSKQVSHFVQASRSNKLIWTVPYESDIQIIEPRQIIN